MSSSMYTISKDPNGVYSVTIAGMLSVR